MILQAAVCRPLCVVTRLHIDASPQLLPSAALKCGGGSSVGGSACPSRWQVAALGSGRSHTCTQGPARSPVLSAWFCANREKEGRHPPGHSPGQSLEPAEHRPAAGGTGGVLSLSVAAPPKAAGHPLPLSTAATPGVAPRPPPLTYQHEFFCSGHRNLRVLNKMFCYNILSFEPCTGL